MLNQGLQFVCYCRYEKHAALLVSEFRLHIKYKQDSFNMVTVFASDKGVIFSVYVFVCLLVCKITGQFVAQGTNYQKREAAILEVVSVFLFNVLCIKD